MKVIDYHFVWSDEERAELAYQEWQQTTEYPNDIQKYSFIKGFIVGLKKAREK